jgi:hypothetical protein
VLALSINGAVFGVFLIDAAVAHPGTIYAGMFYGSTEP